MKVLTREVIREKLSRVVTWVDAECERLEREWETLKHLPIREEQ